MACFNQLSLYVKISKNNLILTGQRKMKQTLSSLARICRKVFRMPPLVARAVSEEEYREYLIERRQDFSNKIAGFTTK